MVEPGPYYMMHFDLLEKLRMTTDEPTKIELCLADVEIAQGFVSDWELYERLSEQERKATAEKYGWEYRPYGPHNIPRYSSFLTLAVYYEKHGEYQAAIDICEQALALGLTIEHTKSGTAGRIARLRKKLEGASK